MIRLGTLDGRWRFKTGENPGDYTLPTLDDSSWDTILVPAHWHNEGYPHFSGEGWYRTHFESPSRAEGDRLGLRFAAVDYWAHVWLNGIDLGEHEGYFAPFMFDITPHLSPSGDNVLVVQVRNPPDVANLIKGAVTRWDCSDPNGNPGGIWKSVELLAITPTEFTSVSTRTTLVAGDLPILHLTAAVNHGRETVAAALRISLVPQNFQGRTFVFEKRVGIHPGEQELCFDFELPDAALWWPWDWGHPSLYTLTLDLEAVDDGERLGQAVQSCGLREITRGDHWSVYVNGQHVFMRGTNYLSDQYMSTVTPERYRTDVELARDANMNAFLVFGNVEKHDFYRICDEHGMLVMQYFSIQYSYNVNPSLVERGYAVLEDMVAMLDIHPSVIAWVMNGEGDERTRTLLSVPLARRCRQLDPTRLVETASFPIMSQYLLNEDPSTHDHRALRSHYTGLTGRMSGQTGANSLVHEFAYMSLPSVDMLREIGIGHIWPPDWEIIIAHNGRALDLSQHEIEGAVAQSLEELVDLTGRYAGEALRYYIDHYRSHRFTYCNGLYHFLLTDCWPAVTWSIVDYQRRPKVAYAYVKEAFSPVNWMPDCPPVFCVPGQDLEIPLHLVNDLPQDQIGHVGNASLKDAQGNTLIERSYALDCRANSGNQVDVLHWQAPESMRSADYYLEMSLVNAESQEVVHHTYRILVREHHIVPLSEPDFGFGGIGYGWFTHELADAGVTCERDDDQTFARICGRRASQVRLLNRIPVRNVGTGDCLQLTIVARATGEMASLCQIVAGLEYTEPNELNPCSDVVCFGPAGEPVRMSLPSNGMWHTLQASLCIPACPVDREMHLWCGFEGAADLTVDLRGLELMR